MPRINTIQLDPSPQLTDKLLGTAVDDGATRNFLISDILSLSTVSGIVYWDEEFSAATQATSQWVALNASHTNINAAITPKGNGANTAQIPDGTASGGNARGEYATDWQKERDANTKYHDDEKHTRRK